MSRSRIRVTELGRRVRVTILPSLKTWDPFALELARVIEPLLPRHRTLTSVQITCETFRVTRRFSRGNTQKFRWPRHMIVEVRPGGDHELQVRLTHGPPFVLLRGERHETLERVARAIHKALSRIPMAGYPGGEHSGLLNYAPRELPYEIEIHRSAEGLTIIIPFRSNPASIAIFAGAMVLLAFLIVFKRAILWLFIPLSILACVAASGELLYRQRKQPLTIVVTKARIRIDDPHCFFRPKIWRREHIKNVSIKSEKRDNQVTRHHVLIEANPRGNIIEHHMFGNDCDLVEMKRMVIALRESLNLPPLEESSFPIE